VAPPSVDAPNQQASGVLAGIRGRLDLIREIVGLPQISINLMLSGAGGNDPFFQGITREFYYHATRRHPAFPLVRRMEYGFAVCHLKGQAQPYSARLDSAARRNLKKAARLGYTCRRINFNEHLGDATRIHQSTAVRQGKPMPEEMLSQQAKPNNDPPSRNPLHDYPYFGVFKDDTMVAYASWMIAGELCAVQTIFGHADYLSDGVVPLVIASMGDHLPDHHPSVAYYAYDMYYGASETMRRFKRKFLFMPHRVKWVLG